MNNSARTVVETQQQKTTRSSSFHTGSGWKIDVDDGPEFWKDQTQFQTQPDMGQRIVSKWKACGTCVTLHHWHTSHVEFESEITKGRIVSKNRNHMAKRGQPYSFPCGLPCGLSAPQFCLIPFLLDKYMMNKYKSKLVLPPAQLKPNKPLSQAAILGMWAAHTWAALEWLLSSLSRYSPPNLATKGQSHSLTTIGSFIIIQLLQPPQKHIEGLCRTQVEKLVINVQYWLYNKHCLFRIEKKMITSRACCKGKWRPLPPLWPSIYTLSSSGGWIMSS